MVQLGSVVKLKVAILKNEIGALGICYDEYKIGEHSGCSIIFENGEYDGFSNDEQIEMLEVVRHRDDFIYTFINVMKLSRDFENGDFAPFIGLKGVRIRPSRNWDTQNVR